MPRRSPPTAAPAGSGPHRHGRRGRHPWSIMAPETAMRSSRDGLAQPLTDSRASAGGLHYTWLKSGFRGERSMADGGRDAAALVAAISVEIGQLSVDIADITGDVQGVSALLDRQTGDFAQIREATGEIVASNQHIAETANLTQRKAAEANTDVVVASKEIDASLGAIERLVRSVTAIGAQLGALESAMQRVGKV